MTANGTEKAKPRRWSILLNTGGGRDEMEPVIAGASTEDAKFIH